MSLWFSRLSFSFINPVSLYNSLKEVNFVPPDMILIASIWTFSKILIKYIVWGSHTTSPYSNSGRIKDKYNFSSDDLSSLNFNIRRIFNLEYALSMASSICLFHEPSSEIVTPRCLWNFTSSSFWLFITRDGLLTFREITIVSVFWELKLTNHVLDQDVIVFKSLLRMSADSIALSTIRNIVSSANNLTWDWILSTISFMYNKKRRGLTNIELVEKNLSCHKNYGLGGHFVKFRNSKKKCTSNCFNYCKCQ